MDRIQEFYSIIFKDETIKNRLQEKIKKISNEEELRKLIELEIIPLAKKNNFNFTTQNLIDYEKKSLQKLSLDELKNINGGLCKSFNKKLLSLMIAGLQISGMHSFAAPPIEETISHIERCCQTFKEKYESESEISNDIQKLISFLNHNVKEELETYSLCMKMIFNDLNLKGSTESTEKIEEVIKNYIREIENSEHDNDITNKTYLNDSLSYRAKQNKRLIRKANKMLEKIKSKIDEDEAQKIEDISQPIMDQLFRSSNFLQESIFILNNPAIPKPRRIDIGEQNGLLDMEMDVSITQALEKDENSFYFENQKLDMLELSEPIFSNEPSSLDIVQGNIGDCYFLSALTTVVQKDPNFIKNSIVDNLDGTVTIRFYNNGEPYYYIITKSVPHDDIGAHDILWVRLFEKAYILHIKNIKGNFKNDGDLLKNKKLSYSEIHGACRTHEAMAHICGSKKSEHGSIERKDICGSFVPFIHPDNIRKNSVGNYSDEAMEFFNDIERRLNSNQILSVTSHKRGVPLVNHIYNSHAYSIVGICKNIRTSTGKRIYCLELRNPHGETIPCYEKNPDGTYSLRPSPTKNNGIFRIDLNDFLDRFNSMHYCKMLDTDE